MKLKVIPEYLVIKGAYIDKNRFDIKILKSKWYVIKIGLKVELEVYRNTKTEAKNYASLMNHFNNNFDKVKEVEQLPA